MLLTKIDAMTLIKSSFKNVTIGVTLGSVLSAILFTLYFNNLLKTTQ